jgi:hypothetical protein
MATEVTVANKALSMIAARGTIAALNETSKEAQTVNLWFDDTRKMLLRCAHWGFARKQLLLTELGNLEDETSLYPWGFKYTYPTDCVKLRYLLYVPESGNDAIPADSLFPASYLGPSRANPFIIGYDVTSTNRVVYTNLEDATGVYTADIEDPNDWDAGFEDAMVAALAAQICLPLSGNANMMVEFRRQAKQILDAARAADGNEAIPRTDHTPDWIAARGIEPGWPYGFAGGMWYQGWDSLSWGE